MESPSIEKSKDFAVEIINLCNHLQQDKREYILSKQLLRSGTSIGANIAEAQRGQSRADFHSKMSISLKEASETSYWLELLHRTNYITEVEYSILNEHCEELIKILASITKQTKTNEPQEFEYE